jgi:hypothetical protein
MMIFVDTALATVELEVGARDTEPTSLLLILVLVELSRVDEKRLDVPTGVETIVLITFVVNLAKPGVVNDRKLDVDIFTGLFGPVMVAELLAVDGSVLEVGA